MRKALERLLRSAGHEAKTFTSALEFLDFSHPAAPGCVILDIQMPKLSGLQLQDRLAHKGITFPIIFITGHGTVPASVRVLKAGAMDFPRKPFKDREFLDAVSRGIEKHGRLRQEQKEMKALRTRLDTLTPREREVFGLVVSGMLNKQVACDLGTTEKTIKVHRARVMEKWSPIPPRPRSLRRKARDPILNRLRFSIGPKSNIFLMLIPLKIISSFMPGTFPGRN